MEIQYIGPLKCKQCGREVPEDRACPRCENGPWWPVVLAFFVCGFAIGGIVYMVVHPRVKAVPVMEVEKSPGGGSGEIQQVNRSCTVSGDVKAFSADSGAMRVIQDELYLCINGLLEKINGGFGTVTGTCTGCIPTDPKRKPIAARVIKFPSNSTEYIDIAPFTYSDPLFPVVVIKGHEKITVMVPKP